MEKRDQERTYCAIDLKSFYSSVECVARGLDPLTTNLVVADVSRTDKTICLAVSPSLKAHGISGRARLFEVVQRMKEVNAMRRMKAPRHHFRGKSYIATEVAADPSLEEDYIAARPRMAEYIRVSTRIYGIYLKYIAPGDMHVYSIDEVIFDATSYLSVYHMTARELCMTMIRDVLHTTGITATAGIGTNPYLCKVAMDIVAKHIPADSHGVRIAELNEQTYRERLWDHKPLTDFWRVGRGIVNRLAPYAVDTMGKIARLSVYHEDLLYSLFGVNAELLIDHAWGWEPVTMPLIKSYRPEATSASSGQVLQRPYSFEQAGVVVREMADELALHLVDTGMMTSMLTLTIGYDRMSLKDCTEYSGETRIDHYGRTVPRHAHGTAHLPRLTSSSRLITEAVRDLYSRITDPALLVRRINLTACNIVSEDSAIRQNERIEPDLFTSYDELKERSERERETLEREHRLQQTILSIKKKYGKNAILLGLNFAEGATQRERNKQIGGHKA